MMVRLNFVKWILFSISAVLLTAGCGRNKAEEMPGQTEIHPSLTSIPIEQDGKFGNIRLKVSREIIREAGFEPGDSADIVLSNNRSCRDIPIYTGFYGNTGEIILVDEEERDYLQIVLFNGNLWEECGLDETKNPTLSLIMNEKGKYIASLEMYDLKQIDSRDSFDSDESFCNFRALKAPGISENKVFRSFSPIDINSTRDEVMDKLIPAYGISYILDLTDTAEEIEETLENDSVHAPNFEALYEKGLVLPMHLSSDYTDVKSFGKNLADGFREMMKYKKPVLFHCWLGKDRTGFVSALLLALGGAEAETIIDDYMKTYENLYGITSENDPVRYQRFKDGTLPHMLKTITGIEKPLEEYDSKELQKGAENYLRDSGMNNQEIEQLKDWLKS